jgi:glycosyltransferase involved in cell wall biosynthesis
MVVVGNEALATHVRAFTPNVVVIPSAVDETRFNVEAAQRGARARKRIVIGWLGHGANLGYLGPLRSVIKELAIRYPGQILLKVVSSEALRWDDVPLENKMWTLDEEAQDVASFDIGIMPLTDDLWSSMKCGYKALLYMSMGVPAVVSPVGVNKTIVTHGETGFHARDSTEWLRVLSDLLEDQNLRERVGQAGRRVVKCKYSIEAVLPLWVNTLRAVSEQNRTKKQNR